MINIVIPMAGAGSRFAEAGYPKPKPFIDVAGKPMIVRVLENMACPDARYVLIARKQHLNSEAALVEKICRDFNAVFVSINELTEGSACTVLHARHLINSDDPLLIANSDQIVDLDIWEFVCDASSRGLDGSILVFRDSTRDPKWSFARTNESGLVAEVREKAPISDLATVGIYLFARGKDFVDATIEMILSRDRVNGEYYTCPAYNYLIQRDRKISLYEIERHAMHGIGTPTDLRAYEKFLSARGF